jgi:hypothetical protein
MGCHFEGGDVLGDRDKKAGIYRRGSPDAEAGLASVVRVVRQIQVERVLSVLVLSDQTRPVVQGILPGQDNLRQKPLSSF